MNALSWTREAQNGLRGPGLELRHARVVTSVRTSTCSLLYVFLVHVKMRRLRQYFIRGKRYSWLLSSFYRSLVSDIDRMVLY